MKYAYETYEQETGEKAYEQSRNSSYPQDVDPTPAYINWLEEKIEEMTEKGK